MGDHKGDPCIYCKVPHDAVPVGHCQGIFFKAGDWVKYLSCCGGQAMDEVMVIENGHVFLRHTQQWLNVVCIEDFRRARW